ncbi:YafY family protein [Paenibacillus sp. NFR01]|uniref:helix-turn-helix transcriptional regulator n=1 Tax=Paenibacillus sp. NFR01 TaxID=1566279 RepID=UPI0008D298E4|nr:YafY family protein [Paenibacillus sp. NFR01]SEU28262.1 Predicted DNA-binding transcriptional regulator YafY, contains an HTH and WYL domains [Paenibacillus sp. NFR01]
MRVNRLLSMLLIISARGLVTGRELAEHFEVSLRTIYRDIEKIGEAGIPIAAAGGKGGGYYIMDHYSIGKLFFNQQEAQAFVAVMEHLGVLFGRNEVFNDIVLKMRSSLPSSGGTDALSVNLSHFSMEQQLKEDLLQMNAAIAGHRLLVFDYINRDMEYAVRTVEPVQLGFAHGHWYLTGYCRKREAYRRFKLVRIHHLRQGEVYVPRALPVEQIRERIDGSYREREIKVRLRFTPQIGPQLTEYFRQEDIRLGEDAHYYVEDRFPYEDGLLKFILGFGKECELLEPADLREELQSYLKNLLLSYNG